MDAWLIWAEELIRTHAMWSIPIVGIIAFGESLAVVGLLIPATAILLLIGTLIGAGILDPIPVLVATIIGAVLGDAVSYYLGRYFGPTIVQRWPLNKHRRSVARARLFFRRFGVISVFLGRFFGPVRSTVPLVGGIVQMGHTKFQVANVASAMVWAPLMLAPGYLTAQGVGNMLCGVLGALPMTGVIVRSSANVQAGARTRLSAMLHALWLLAAVVLLAALLEQIPVASLAGVLVYTGLKLIDLDALRQLGRYGRMAMLIHVATALTIVATDLLTGVLLGFALTLAQLAWQASRLKIGVVRDGRRVELRMQGAATFLRVPQLARALQGVPQDAWLHVPMAHLRYIDHACMELLEEWQRANQASGARLIIEARALTRRVEGRRRQAAHLAAAAAGN